MKILKISLSSREQFQDYSHLNYEPFSLEIESLQFMAHFENAPILLANSKHLKFWIVTHFLELFTTKNLFSENFENYTCGGVLKFFSTFSVGFNYIRENPELLELIACNNSVPRHIWAETSFIWIWSTIIK